MLRNTKSEKKLYSIYFKRLENNVMRLSTVLSGNDISIRTENNPFQG